MYIFFYKESVVLKTFAFIQDVCWACVLSMCACVCVRACVCVLSVCVLYCVVHDLIGWLLCAVPSSSTPIEWSTSRTRTWQLSPLMEVGGGKLSVPIIKSRLWYFFSHSDSVDNSSTQERRCHAEEGTHTQDEAPRNNERWLVSST